MFKELILSNNYYQWKLIQIMNWIYNARGTIRKLIKRKLNFFLVSCYCRVKNQLSICGTWASGKVLFVGGLSKRSSPYLCEFLRKPPETPTD